MTHYLLPSELAALIDAPDQQTPSGRRDHALLLFLARTGARVSEALAVNASDLQLDRAMPQVLLHARGRKPRMASVAEDLAKALGELLRERGVSSHEPLPLFVGTHGQRLTHLGARHVVRRAAAAASRKIPELSHKHISPRFW